MSKHEQKVMQELLDRVKQFLNTTKTDPFATRSDEKIDANDDDAAQFLDALVDAHIRKVS